MFFMWVLYGILGIIVVGCLFFGYYQLTDFPPYKRILILLGGVVGLVLLIWLISVAWYLWLLIIVAIAFAKDAF